MCEWFLVSPVSFSPPSVPLINSLVLRACPHFGPLLSWNGGSAVFRHLPLLLPCEHAHLSGLCSLGTGRNTAFRCFPVLKRVYASVGFLGDFHHEHVRVSDLCSLGTGGNTAFRCFPVLKRVYASVGFLGDFHHEHVRVSDLCSLGTGRNTAFRCSLCPKMECGVADASPLSPTSTSAFRTSAPSE